LVAVTEPVNQTNARRTTVAVLYGGQSTEHSVSCISAAAVMSSLDPERYEVVPVGITENGIWVKGTTDTEKLTAHGKDLPTVAGGRSVTFDLGSPVRPGTDGSAGERPRGTSLRFGDGSLYAQVDVVFPVLHGVHGEDGTVQGLLELANVPYVGSGVFASAACMDKQYTKAVARHEGIPVGDEIVLDEQRDLTDEEQERLGLPVFVKPARGGSSIGVSKVSDWADLETAEKSAFLHDDKILVEAMLRGVEVECGVLQYPDGTVQASYPSMLTGTEDGPEGFYGFDTKYLDDIISYEIPAPLPEAQVAEIRRLAVETFNALDCSGLARVDFFVTEDGPVLNEPNTMPGFTPISMYPKMFEATGVAYPDLLDILIAQALR
jgi:D-alanine-D-alanine ligase